MISQTPHSKGFVRKPYNVSLIENILQMGFFFFRGVEGVLFSPQIVYGKGLALIKNKLKKVREQTENCSRTFFDLFANKMEILREQNGNSSRTIFDFFAKNFLCFF